MEREESKEGNVANNTKITKKTLVLGVLPFIVVGVMLLFLLNSYGLLIQTSIKSLPEISIEKVEFGDNQIIASIRNTGPSEVTIAQADVNDRIHPAAIEPSKTLPRLGVAKVLIPFNWNPGEPYGIGITVDDGARFSKLVKAAAPAPHPTFEQASTFALIGTYVGIIPVMMGLLWYPFIRRLSLSMYNFFLSITVGLLVFLGIDALFESNKIAADSIAPIFNAQILIIIVAFVSLLTLLYISQTLVRRASKSSGSAIKTNKKYMERLESENEEKSEDFSSSSTNISSPRVSYQQKFLIKPVAISMMIALGIGLHNFGEGLAIGAATLLGELALSSFLILGFTLHNTTEGLAIVSPIARSGKIALRKLLVMGIIAGAPTIVGAWIGGFLYSPLLTIVFLSVGAGAIFQVVYQLGSWMYHTNRNKEIGGNVSIIAGFAVGMLIMYITGLLI
jgi:ZIP family zinc transporter